jgi:prolipoprotein diacylglyceryltransferase
MVPFGIVGGRLYHVATDPELYFTAGRNPWNTFKIWDGGLGAWADHRFTLGHGRAFALYVAAHTLGRVWIEYLRLDTANHIPGLRLNDWTCVIVFTGAVAYFVISARRHPGRESLTGAAAPADGAAPSAR